MRFDVEQKARRSAFNPTVGHGGNWDRVIGGVDFNEGKVRRVVGEPIGGRRCSGGIERSARKQRGIGPAGGSEKNAANAGGHGRKSSEGSGLSIECSGRLGDHRRSVAGHQSGSSSLSLPTLRSLSSIALASINTSTSGLVSRNASSAAIAPLRLPTEA